MMHKRITKCWILSCLMMWLPMLSAAQAMVHVHYNGVFKMDYQGMNAVQLTKKGCDILHQQHSPLAKPFKVSGNPKDLESYTEDVYISPENAYYATYKQGYKLAELKKVLAKSKLFLTKKSRSCITNNAVHIISTLCVQMMSNG